MSLNIIDFKNINYFFGNAIKRMKNRTLSFLLDNDRDGTLKILEIMLKELESKSNASTIF